MKFYSIVSHTTTNKVIHLTLNDSWEDALSDLITTCNILVKTDADNSYTFQIVGEKSLTNPREILMDSPTPI